MEAPEILTTTKTAAASAAPITTVSVRNDCIII
jgi:hypothetical protein